MIGSAGCCSPQHSMISPLHSDWEGSSLQKRATKVGRWTAEVDGLVHWNRHMFWLFDSDWRSGPVDTEASFFSRLHPDDVSAWRETDKTAQHSTGGYDAACRCVWRDGTVLKIKVFACKENLAGGRTATTGTCVNMTELQRLHNIDMEQMQHEQMQHCALYSKQQKQHAIAAVGQRGRSIQPGSWSLGRCIAVGSYGAVHEAVHVRRGLVFAVKIIPIKTQSLDQQELGIYRRTCNEVYILRSLQHTNIVAYYGAEVHGDQLCILQEFVSGGSLGLMLQTAGALSQELTHHYAHQILQGLIYLHTHCIVHRDLKAENVLISVDGTVKLADFGASVHVFADTLPAGKIFGSPYFSAPEILQQQQYGLAVDIWAFGCTVLQMLSGQPPWSSMQLKTMPALIHAMQESQPRTPPLPASLSLAVRKLLTCCFKWDPQQRPNAFELLSHDLCNSRQCAQCTIYTGSSCSVDAGSELSRSSSSNSNVLRAKSKDVDISSNESLLSNSATASNCSDTCTSVSIKVDTAGLSSSRRANPYATHNAANKRISESTGHYGISISADWSILPSSRSCSTASQKQH